MENAKLLVVRLLADCEGRVKPEPFSVEHTRHMGDYVTYAMAYKTQGQGNCSGSIHP